MILNDIEVAERLESPDNLWNRLRELAKAPCDIPSLPKADDVIEDLEDKLAHSSHSIKSKAAAIAALTLDELKTRLPEVQKPEKLAAIAESMNKILAAENNKKAEDKPSQYIIYAPTTINEEKFEVIHSRE